MLSICFSLGRSLPVWRWNAGKSRIALRPTLRIRLASTRTPMSANDDSGPLDYDSSTELLGFDVDTHSSPSPVATNLRSWFGPNGQYIRELPCPSCRGRGYTPCTECGIERSRSDCSQCNGKGIRTCRQCLGDCVIWEESIDEQPWEKARSSSPLKVQEDDEVDKLDIKSLNAKTGLFSKHMKIIHRDPKLHAQRVAAIKKAKGTAEARKQASEALKAFFRNPENRLKRSIAMKGVKFYCSNCGQEGHRRHYCPTLRQTAGVMQFKCQLCGERGHNRRTCGKLKAEGETKKNQMKIHHCSLCRQRGHNRRTCLNSTQLGGGSAGSRQIQLILGSIGTYVCSLCSAKGHNRRTCPTKKAN